jgi:hypothetical protein
LAVHDFKQDKEMRALLFLQRNTMSFYLMLLDIFLSRLLNAAATTFRRRTNRPQIYFYTGLDVKHF